MEKTIHFICRGNTFRSRMAEAYFNSLNVPGWKATSSGVGASRNENGPITVWAQAVLEPRYLLSFTAPTWTQTSKELLKQINLVIFMQQAYLDTCRADLNFTPANYLVWDVADISDEVLRNSTEEEIIAFAEATFAKIKSEIDELIESEGILL